MLLELELGVAAGEHVVVRLLDAGVADDERLVAGDLREQVAPSGYSRWYLKLAVARRDRPGDDHAVGGEDLAARAVEVARARCGR